MACGPGTDVPMTLRVVHPMPNRSRPGTGHDYVSGSISDPSARITVNGVVAPVSEIGTFLAYVRVGSDKELRAHEVVATRGRDTVRAYVPIGAANPKEAPQPRGRRGYAVNSRMHLRIGQAVIVRSDVDDQELIGRLTTPGDYVWRLLPGTEGVVLDSSAEEARLRLADTVSVWVSRRIIRPIDKVKSPPVLRAETLPTSSRRGEIHVFATRAPTFKVFIEGDRLVFKVFGAVHQASKASAQWREDIGTIESRADSSGLTYALGLRGPVFGYEVVWKHDRIVLRVRQPPRINRRRPLHGLTVLVDPGHPPGGAIGPGGSREADVVFALAQQLATVLKDRGAIAILTKNAADAPVSLSDRVRIARNADAHAIVSLHADAVPDGANPDHYMGATVLASQVHAMPLAAATFMGIEEQTNRKGRGFAFGDFAIVRPTWAPAILCEVVTITIPEEEILIVDASYRVRLALGIVRGLEVYFSALDKHTYSRSSG